MSRLHLRLASPALLALLCGASLLGCDTTDSLSLGVCDVSLHALEPAEALVGEQISATGRPFTDAYDTAVYVGSARATISEITREGCDACDDCLEDQLCTGCDDCDPCDLLCGDCIETVAFTVPNQDPGDTVVRLFNRHGESNALDFEVLAPPQDTGPTDTGPTDTGPTDTGPTDTASDTGPSDTGSSDSSSPDTASDTAVIQ